MIEPGEHCTSLRKKAGKKTRGQKAWKEQSKKWLGHTWEIIHYSRSTFLRGIVQGYASRGTKEPVPFSSPTSQHKYIATGRKQLNTDSGCLTCLYQTVCPCALVGLPFSVKLASLPVWLVLPQEDQHKPLSTPSIKTGVLKVCKLGWNRAQKALCCSWKEGRKKPRGRQHIKSNLKNAWGTQEGRLFTILKALP